MVSDAHTRKPSGVLIVEDDPLVASCIKEILDELGIPVVGLAASGTAALALAEEELPQLALVDIGLFGEMDGVEVACELRRRHAIPAIFLSGHGDAETLRRSRIAHPLGFLRKPFRPSQVFNAIEQALAQCID